MSTEITCYHCQKELDMLEGSSIHRNDDCPHCGVDLYCCKMCQFYDLSCYNECREPCADRIVDKEKANFCDYFRFGKLEVKLEKKQSMLSAADALFKK